MESVFDNETIGVVISHIVFAGIEFNNNVRIMQNRSGAVKRDSHSFRLRSSSPERLCWAAIFGFVVGTPF